MSFSIVILYLHVLRWFSLSTEYQTDDECNIIRGWRFLFEVDADSEV